MTILKPVRWLKRGGATPIAGSPIAFASMDGGQGPAARGTLLLPRDIDDELQSELATEIKSLLKAGVIDLGDEEFLVLEEQFTRLGTSETRVRRSFLARLRIAGEGAAKVLQHEKVFAHAIADRVRVNLETRLSIAPLLLTYRDVSGDVERVLSAATPRGDYVDTMGVRVRVSALRAMDANESLSRALAGLSFVIADGHHRYAAAVQTVDALDAANARSASDDEAYVLALLVEETDPGLVIEPTHRLLHGIEGFSFEALLAKISRWVSAQSADRLEAPQSGAVLAVLPGGARWLLRPKGPEVMREHPVVSASAPACHGLDVAWLHAVIIKGALGLEPGTPAWRAHVRFLTGELRPELVAQVAKGNALFVVASPPPGVIRAVAEAADTLPQKSTAYHPKAPAGLTLHFLGADL